MINKDQAKQLTANLNQHKDTIFNEYQRVENNFKAILATEGEFDAGGLDYQIHYTGCDFPSYCTVEKIYLSENGNTIYVELQDTEGGDTFDVPITDISGFGMYDEHICNLYGLAIDYFTKQTALESIKE